MTQIDWDIRAWTDQRLNEKGVTSYLVIKKTKTIMGVEKKINYQITKAPYAQNNSEFQRPFH